MHEEIANAIQAYLAARRHFFEVAKRYPNEIGGNDNIIGRIGEYFALQFLRKEGRLPAKTKSLSQEGFDLEEAREEGKLRISVKILTSENTIGRAGRLTDPWDEFMLIQLSATNLSGRVGLITREQFNQALVENLTWVKKPIVKTTMLGKRGLIGKYGIVETVTGFL